MLKKTLAALVLITCLVVTTPAPSALAGEEGGGPYAGCSLSVTPTRFRPGRAVTVSGDGFEPGFTGTLIVRHQAGKETELGDFTTDGSGSFGPTSYTVPAQTQHGNSALLAPCDSSGEDEARVEVIVSGPNTSSSGISSSKSTVSRTERFTVTVEGAEPGSEVEFFQFSSPRLVGTAVADGNGVATMSMEFPSDAELAAHRVEARGVDADGEPFTLSYPITVASRSGAGSDVQPFVVAGAIALLLGAVAVLVARRRGAGALAG